MRFMIDRYFKDEPMDRLNKGLFAFASSVTYVSNIYKYSVACQLAYAETRKPSGR